MRGKLQHLYCVKGIVLKCVDATPDWKITAGDLAYLYSRGPTIKFRGYYPL
jgi:hypothetical protein